MPADSAILDTFKTCGISLFQVIFLIIFLVASSEKVGFVVPRKRTLWGEKELFRLCFDSLLTRNLTPCCAPNCRSGLVAPRVSYLKPGFCVLRKIYSRSPRVLTRIWSIYVHKNLWKTSIRCCTFFGSDQL